jgi:multiple RNA-binding domain-containing protein 1
LKKAQSSHNWNSLFVSQDAVANLMATRYNIDKSDIFDVHGTGKNKSNAAVKLAVGETQIVNDMRKFLVRNGVKLDSFQNSNSTERSKTVMLVKNLPGNTKESELKEMFAKAKVTEESMKRFVMPEYGTAALVEFAERQEARDAFKKLAYRKFKSVPIYLEWAPVDVFDGSCDEKNEEQQESVIGFCLVF